MKTKNYLVVLLLLLAQVSIVSAQEWQLDLNKAQNLAQETDRNIILVFSGSDWCAPCIKLEKEIWQSAEFQAYAKENYVMLRADFPRKKANQLAEATIPLILTFPLTMLIRLDSVSNTQTFLHRLICGDLV